MTLSARGRRDSELLTGVKPRPCAWRTWPAGRGGSRRSRERAQAPERPGPFKLRVPLLATKGVFGDVVAQGRPVSPDGPGPGLRSAVWAGREAGPRAAVSPQCPVLCAERGTGLRVPLEV